MKIPAAISLILIRLAAIPSTLVVLVALIVKATSQIAGVMSAKTIVNLLEIAFENIG